MEKVQVVIGWEGGNFSAYAPILDGCAATGQTPEEIKQEIKEAIRWHIETSIEDGESVPNVFKGDYELTFKFDAQSLLRYYKNVFGNKGIESITGINQKQLNHYATGHRAPSEKTIKKIEDGVHNFAKELLEISL
jgi:predicted RNase H-like HicB family nuclease